MPMPPVPLPELPDGTPVVHVWRNGAAPYGTRSAQLPIRVVVGQTMPASVPDLASRVTISQP